MTAEGNRHPDWGDCVCMCIQVKSVGFSCQQSIYPHSVGPCPTTRTLKEQNIWHRLGKIAAILTSHSLSGDTQNNFIYWVHKSLHLSHPWGRVWGGLAPSGLKYWVNTGHIPSPTSLGKICIRFSGNSTYDQCILFVMTTFFSIFSTLCLDHSHRHGYTNWIHTPILLENCTSLQKLWGAAGVVRGFQYQIGHKDSIHTRLNHHHCLLGITITTNNYQPCTPGMGDWWRTGSLEAEEGEDRHWVLWG